MKRMSRLGALASVVVLMLAGASIMAGELVIDSFDSTGRLIFAENTNTLSYRVEWASSPSGPWTNFSAAAVALDDIPAMGSGNVTSSVPVFYRVVSTPDPALYVAGDYLVIDLSAGPSASSYPVSYMSTRPSGGWTDEYKTTKLVMRRIPAGTFTMGSPPLEELGRNPHETPHQVTLTQDYYMGVFSVTQKQWERVMGNWPSYFNNTSYRDARPVEKVSYYDIRENPNNSAIDPHWPESSQVHVNSFMGKLRAKTGLTELDLPTEAQWERAARALTTSALNSGKNLTDTWSCPNMDQVGRWWANHPAGRSTSSSVSTDGGTAKVGSYRPNAWGLYDMHGNVQEWCLDWYGTHSGDSVTDPTGPSLNQTTSKVLRGGSWNGGGGSTRSASRLFAPPNTRLTGSVGNEYALNGFRLSMTLP